MKPARFVLLALLIASYFLIVDSSVLAADTVGPQTQASLDPASPDGSNGWYRSPLEVTLSSSDDLSGVKTIYWKLDSGAWNHTDFSQTLNLAPNSSFELISGSTVDDWTFAGTPSSSGSSDTAVAEFGGKSAKVVSGENGWSGFRNQASYGPAAPFSNMTASVWLKTQNVTGNGAYFRVFALSTSQGAVEITSSFKTTGTSDFTRISKTFVVSVSDAYGVFVDLGVFGTGTVWFDGVEIKNSATDTYIDNTFSAPGSHSLEYYAQDFSLNEELPHKVLTFKVDSTSPSNWRGFTTDQSGSDHTLKSEIKVDDSVSLPDPAEARFQYSVDGGLTWGYYSDLTSCSSNFVADGWSDLVTTESENGGQTLEIKTAAVDYCNSNWQICKIVRFKVKDLAGNEAQKSICINGSWVKSGGDVGSNYNISFASSGGSDNADGLIISKGAVAGFTSSSGWTIQNYGALSLKTYAEWLSKFPTTTTLPSGKLPVISGRFINNSSFTISSSTIPASFGTATFTAVVFVNGNLTINSNLSLSNSSAVAFIVSGDVLVDKNVDAISGAYLVDGKFDTSYNGNKGTKLTVNGLVSANTIDFNRSLSQNPETMPAEEIFYKPNYLTLLSSQIGEALVSWREIAP